MYSFNSFYLDLC